MKRQKRKAKRHDAATATASPRAEGPRKAPSRRGFMKGMTSWGLVVAAVGGGGWYLAQDVMATINEQDLSLIGDGTPTVVQIHDPQCSQCAALQREAREAMAAFDDDELRFLVANIRSTEGRALATAHGVGHVTLLLFDGAGQRRNVLTGPSSADVLEEAFRRHVVRSSTS